MITVYHILVLDESWLLHFWYIGAIQLLAALLRIQSTTNVLGKAAEDGWSSWVTDIHMANQDGVPGYWLCPGPDLGTTAICGQSRGVNHQMENLFLCFFYSLLQFVFQISEPLMKERKKKYLDSYPLPSQAH